MKVSIIIPVYNAEATIARAIQSCINQTYSNIEIICVNDGSLDNSLQILHSFSDDRIIIIDQENAGVVAARKIGVIKSTGDFLFFLDADDSLIEKAIEILTNALLIDDTIDLVRGNIGMFDENLNFLGENEQMKKDSGLIMSGWSFIHYYLKAFPSLCATLVRRDLFERLDYVSEDIKVGEDLLTVFELAQRCRKVYIEGEVVYNYIRNPKSVMNSIHIPDNKRDFSVSNCKLVCALYDKFLLIRGKDKSIDIVVEEYLIDTIISRIIDKEVKRMYRKSIRKIYLSCFLFDFKMHKYLCNRLYREYIHMLLYSYKYLF